MLDTNIDAHCHLPSQDHGDITGTFVLGGIDSADWQAQRALKVRLPGQVFCTFGIHPWTVDAQEELALDLMWEELLTLLPKAVAVGETGLDKVRCTRGLGRQLKWFQRHIEIGRPLVLHIVRAHREALSALPAKCQGLVHGFTGDFATAKGYLDRGLYLGIGPRYRRCKHFADLARLPRDQIVLETDAPIGELDIAAVALDLAQTATAAATLLEQTTVNARRLFALEVVT